MAKTKITKTIFFIEDEKYLVSAVSQFLKKKGYLVEVAYTGAEALQKLPVTRPDLILLDIVLPEMNGIELLKKIQSENDALSKIPVLVLTNLQGDEKSFEKLGVEIAGYFVKANISLEELLTKIEEILAK